MCVPFSLRLLVVMLIEHVVRACVLALDPLNMGRTGQNSSSRGSLCEQS